MLDWDGCQRTPEPPAAVLLTALLLLGCRPTFTQFPSDICPSVRLRSSVPAVPCLSVITNQLAQAVCILLPFFPPLLCRNVYSVNTEQRQKGPSVSACVSQIALKRAHLQDVSSVGGILIRHKLLPTYKSCALFSIPTSVCLFPASPTVYPSVFLQALLITIPSKVRHSVESASQLVQFSFIGW